MFCYWVFVRVFGVINFEVDIALKKESIVYECYKIRGGVNSDGDVCVV